MGWSSFEKQGESSTEIYHPLERAYTGETLQMMIKELNREIPTYV